MLVWHWGIGAPAVHGEIAAVPCGPDCSLAAVQYALAAVQSALAQCGNYCLAAISIAFRSSLTKRHTYPSPPFLPRHFSRSCVDRAMSRDRTSPSRAIPARAGPRVTPISLSGLSTAALT